MTDQPLPSIPTKKPVHLPSAVMIVTGLLGALILLSGAGFTFLGGIASLFNPDSDTIEAAILFSYSVAGLFLSSLLVPSIILAFRRMGGKPAETQSGIWENFIHLVHPKGMIWFYPFLLLAGYFLNKNETFNWLFMPVINVLVLAIPIAWLLWMGTRKFFPSSMQRNWSAFGIGMTLGPILIFVIEITVILAGVIVFGFLIMTVFPDMQAILEELVSTLQSATTSAQISQDAIVEFLQYPGVVAILLLFVSGFVPLVEEIFKPVAVWLLWGRQLSLQDGWTLGLLSGAGFALVENLGNVAVGEGWLFIVLARGGASALHIFNSALIGYTFVLARKKKRYLPPVLALAGTILVHALWNGMTVFATINLLSNPAGSTEEMWSPGYVVLLTVISLTMIAGILLINRKLAKGKNNTESDQDPAEPELPVEMQIE